MKKLLILFFIAFFVISIPLFSQQEFLFRGLPWGATPEQVKAKEGEPGKRSTDGVKSEFFSYQGKPVAGRAANLTMRFITDKGLTDAAYSFSFQKKYLMANEPNPTEPINIYVELKEKLISLYGQPKQTDSLSKITGGISTLMAQQYRNNLPYLAWWEVNDTRIYLSLNFSEYDQFYALYLNYISKPLWNTVAGYYSDSTDGL